MESDKAFTRRVCAVLLADLTGFSTLMGEDDELTARAVQHLQTLLHGIIAEAHGQAESFGGDAFFATFDSVVGAVDAAITIQRRVAAETFAGRRLQIRIGVHFGDVLLREGVGLAGALGDAINIAARLQALAKPGTICISEGVYRQARNKFDEQFIDLGRQRLKNISGPVHAYLVVPRQLAGLHAHSRRRLAMRWAIGAAAVGAVGVIGVVLSRSSLFVRPRVSPERVPPVLSARPGPESASPEEVSATEGDQHAGPVALGVMEFKGRGESASNDWRREALRDGLNTQLSGLSHVKVYSKEFIDFLITRKGLTEIEAASQLGIKKMLSGSFVEAGGVLHIETHIVDVASGVIEASYTTSGSEQEFQSLQNNLALGVIARLNLPVTAEEKKTLLAQENTNIEALKMLLEAERGAAKSSPTASPESGAEAPHSALPQWFARYGSLAAPALADEAPAEAAVKDVLERLRRATEAREVQALAALYTEFPPDLQAAQQKYFENVRELRIAIDHVDIAVVGDEAVVSYTRTDDFVDARTGRPMRVAVRLTKTLRREDGAWKLIGGT